MTELSDRTLVGTMLPRADLHRLSADAGHDPRHALRGRALGWTYAFMILAIGPAIGISAMARLRARSGVASLAGGRR